MFIIVTGNELFVLDLREEGGIGKVGLEKFIQNRNLIFVNLLNRTHAIVKQNKKIGRELEKGKELHRHRFKFKYDIRGYNGLFIVFTSLSPQELLTELFNRIPKTSIFKAHSSSDYVLLRLKDHDYLNETIYQLSNIPAIEGFDLYRNVYKNDYFSSLVLKTTSSRFNYTGKNQIISIADTGLDFKHCAFSPSDHLKRYTLSDAEYENLKRTISGYNFHKDVHKILLYFKVSFFDGLRSHETDFSDRIGGHGTHVAGLAAGDESRCSGVQLPTPKSDAKIFFLDMENSNSTDEHLTPPPLFTPFMNLVYQAGSRIFTNSWGSATCEYTFTAMEMDRFVYFHPDFIILVAAGNSGPGNFTVGSPAVLKNGITIGASQNSRESFLFYAKYAEFWEEGRQLFDEEDIHLKSYSEHNLADFSSRGPTADGRIKPDLICPGQYSLSSKAHGWRLLMQGTSMATPECARLVALTIEYLQTVHNILYPTLDLVKGLLINTADSLSGSAQRLYLSREKGTLFTVKTKAQLGLFDQGFGIANFEKLSTNQSYFLQSSFSSHFPKPQKICFKTRETSPISLTLTWVDPPAFLHSQKTLMNNLNMLVVRNSASGVYGNHLNTPDDLNTVERVRILSTEGDSIVVYVFTDNNPLLFLKPVYSQKFTLSYTSTLTLSTCASECDEWAPPFFSSENEAYPCDKETTQWSKTPVRLCDLYSIAENNTCTCISNKPCTLDGGVKGTQYCEYNGSFSECHPEYKFVSFLPVQKARGVRLLLNILESSTSTSITWEVWLAAVLFVQFYFILYFSFSLR